MTQTANPEGPVRPGGRAMERGQQAAPAAPDFQVDPTLPPPNYAPKPYDAPSPLGGDDNLLYGPTTRPNEPITAGAYPGGKLPIPPEAQVLIPLLHLAAQAPDAPPQLRGLLQLLLYHQNGQ